MKVTQEADINKGFNSLIKTFDHIADRSKQTMPLLTSALRHSIEVVKLYKEAFNSVKDKKE